MSCLFCCCSSKEKDPGADKNAKKNTEKPPKLSGGKSKTKDSLLADKGPKAKDSLLADKGPKAKDSADRMSMRSRTSVSRDIQKPRRPSQIRAVVKPKDGSQNTRTDKNASAQNDAGFTATGKRRSISGRQLDSGSESDVSYNFPVDVTQADLEAKNRINRCDSFNAELRAQAAGIISDLGGPAYLIYGTNLKDKESSFEDLMLSELRKERDDFLKQQPLLVEAVVRRMNLKRSRPPFRDPLRLDQELCDIACQVWHDRARIRDGFVIAPRCVCFPRGLGRLSRCGCLTYYTPMTDRLDMLDKVAKAMVFFWCHEGRLYSERKVSIGATSIHNFNNVFPVLNGAKYVSDESKLQAAFDKYRKDFASQILSGKCTKVGLHMDVARDVRDPARNIICVTAVFDYVTCAFGRVMDTPC